MFSLRVFTCHTPVNVVTWVPLVCLHVVGRVMSYLQTNVIKHSGMCVKEDNALGAVHMRLSLNYNRLLVSFLLHRICRTNLTQMFNMRRMRYTTSSYIDFFSAICCMNPLTSYCKTQHCTVSPRDALKQTS